MQFIISVYINTHPENCYSYSVEMDFFNSYRSLDSEWSDECICFLVSYLCIFLMSILEI